MWTPRESNELADYSSHLSTTQMLRSRVTGGLHFRLRLRIRSSGRVALSARLDWSIATLGGVAIIECMRKKLSPLSSPSPREAKKPPKKRVCENFGVSTFPSRSDKNYIYILDWWRIGLKKVKIIVRLPHNGSEDPSQMMMRGDGNDQFAAGKFWKS